MSKYKINYSFPIDLFFSFENKKYNNFKQLWNDIKIHSKPKTGSKDTVAEAVAELTDSNLDFDLNSRKMTAKQKEEKIKDIENKTKNVVYLLNKRKRKLTKEDLLYYISTNNSINLIYYFTLNYIRICNSDIDLINKDDLKDSLDKFNDIDKFLSIVNTRIKFSVVNSQIEKIEKNTDVANFNKSKLITDLIEILHKNAFLELAEAVYSSKDKTHHSYFSFRKYEDNFKIGLLISSIDSNVYDREKLSTLFKAKDKEEISIKIDELKHFDRKRNRELMVFNTIANSIEFIPSLSQHKKSKILLPILKHIQIPIFYNEKSILENRNLTDFFRYFRKNIKKQD